MTKLTGRRGERGRCGLQNEEREVKFIRTLSVGRVTDSGSADEHFKHQVLLYSNQAHFVI